MQTTFSEILFSKAQAAPRRIILPESHDARILQAATIAERAGLAQCILLGERDEIVARYADLPEDIEVLSVNADAYVARVVAANKKYDEDAARALLQSPSMMSVIAATLTKEGYGDGVVSGAATTSADVLRAYLRVIGTASADTRASSVFFMCFPDGVRLFADCAMNVTPNAAELAQIAIQTARTARGFDIEPRVAMLSYASSRGKDGDPVSAAVDIVKEQCGGEVCIDGPLQYDAAVNPDIAARKAKDSPVAGRANVLIFPNIYAGNIAYKAVQQAAGIIAVGPILQGFAHAVNDLSRGASVDDIVHTIAMTSAMA